MLDSMSELLAKIHLGEDSLLELKSMRFRGDKKIDLNREKIADEIAAFANTNEGVIIFGVDDNTRAIEGIPIDKLDIAEEFIRGICHDAIDPPVFVRIIRLELPDTLGNLKPVLKVEIPRSLFVHKSPGGYFRRIGSSKRELNPESLARLFQQRSQTRIIRFDEQPVPGTSPDILEENLWQRFVGISIDDPGVFLEKIRIITQDEAGSFRVTVGGLLMCCPHPEEYLPNAIIEAVRYKGSTRDSNYQIDAAQIKGPLDHQISLALAFVMKNMQVAARKDPGRIEIPQYNLRAVFEAVVNAVAHRDYSLHGSKIRLFMFDDRLEIFSPGAIPNTMTIESLPLRQSTRNELIASLLARCPSIPGTPGEHRQFIMEKRGEGVPVIIKESLELSGKKPVFSLIDEIELLLTIFAAKPQIIKND
ncbi:MAG: putative DNA binding domain-containing protein [Acidobacteria bacterium]|jgi:predicted HTH transcriptional regulator|nr:putative DNA binding domain-containing protein [Acidobacteriota bacterium]